MTTLRAAAALFALALLSGCAETRLVTCHVETTPTSAEVWISGGKEGKLEQRDSTPCDLLFKEPGEYEVHLKKPGYMSVMRRVTVLEGPDAKGNEGLKALPESMTVTLDPVEGDPKPAAAGSEEPAPYYYGD